MICFKKCVKMVAQGKVPNTCQFCGNCDHACNGHPERRFDNTPGLPWHAKKIEELSKRERLVDRRIPGRKA